MLYDEVFSGARPAHLSYVVHRAGSVWTLSVATGGKPAGRLKRSSDKDSGY
jgi:hypothetical protein